MADMQASGFAVELDALTLARAQRADAAARECIYRLYADAAYSLALRLTGRPADAEDVVQEGFVKAFERIGSYRGEAPFGAWLKRLMVNAAIDRLRHERRWPADPDAVEGLPVTTHAAEARIDALGLLARLSPAARSVVWLHQMEGYSHPEIAAMFGHSESWSKSLLARSLDRLREWLQAEDKPR